MELDRVSEERLQEQYREIGAQIAWLEFDIAWDQARIDNGDSFISGELRERINRHSIDLRNAKQKAANLIERMKEYCRCV